MRSILLPCFAAAFAQERDPGTAFAVAIEDHDAGAVRELLKSGLSTETTIDYGEHKITPLMKAAWDGDEEIVKLLLDAGASVEDGASGLTPLQFAASAGNVGMIRFLARRGADVNRGVKTGGQTALLYAIYGAHPDAVQALIELKADVNAKTKDGDTPLKAAMKGDQEDLIAMLKAAGAKP
jgi:ankyrin repeat protein